MSHHIPSQSTPFVGRLDDFHKIIVNLKQLIVVEFDFKYYAKINSLLFNTFAKKQIE
jgi:hypothetical protein